MDIKLLLGILNRPWFMEPAAAQQWAELAGNILKSGSMPVVDKRDLVSGQYYGTGPLFRVNRTGAVDPKGEIQVFRMSGPMAKYDYCNALGSQSWIQHFNAAYADDGIKAIVNWVDGPGGQVDGTESLANNIRARNKPVITYADGMMCSAHYWVGSSGDEIVVDASNDGWNLTIGSIGTMVMWEDDTEKRQKEGVKLMTVFADDSADKWGSYFDIKNGDYTRLKAELNGLNAPFQRAVKENRAGKLNLEKENVLTGKTYNANEAVANGLADRKGTFLDAVKRAISLSNKKVKSQQMQTTLLAFGAVLVAAKATEFQVTEGGFLVTEEHLNNIEAKLDQDQTTASATAGALKNLQAQAETFKTAEKTASELIAANSKITELEASLKTANEKIAALGETPGAPFAAPAAGADDQPDKKKKKVYSFDKIASEVL